MKRGDLVAAVAPGAYGKPRPYLLGRGRSTGALTDLLERLGRRWVSRPPQPCSSSMRSCTSPSAFAVARAACMAETRTLAWWRPVAAVLARLAQAVRQARQVLDVPRGRARHVVGVAAAVAQVVLVHLPVADDGGPQYPSAAVAGMREGDMVDFLLLRTSWNAQDLLFVDNIEFVRGGTRAAPTAP